MVQAKCARQTKDGIHPDHEFYVEFFDGLRYGSLGIYLN